jgi:hypothetical protein
MCKLKKYGDKMVNFTGQSINKSNCMFLMAIYISLPAVGGQVRGKPHLPT